MQHYIPIQKQLSTIHEEESKDEVNPQVREFINRYRKDSSQHKPGDVQYFNKNQPESTDYQWRDKQSWSIATGLPQDNEKQNNSKPPPTQTYTLNLLNQAKNIQVYGDEHYHTFQQQTKEIEQSAGISRKLSQYFDNQELILSDSSIFGQKSVIEPIKPGSSRSINQKNCQGYLKNLSSIMETEQQFKIIEEGPSTWQSDCQSYLHNSNIHVECCEQPMISNRQKNSSQVLKDITKQGNALNLYISEQKGQQGPDFEQLTAQIVERVIQVLNKSGKKEDQSKTATPKSKRSDTDIWMSNQSNKTNRLSFQSNTVQLSIANKRSFQEDCVPAVVMKGMSKQTEEDDSFIRYIQEVMIKKHKSSDQLPNLIKLDQENYTSSENMFLDTVKLQGQCTSRNYEYNKQKCTEFQQRQQRFIQQRDMKVKQKRAEQEKKKEEEEYLIFQYQKQKQQKQKQNEQLRKNQQTAYNRLYQDATRRQDRKEFAEIKLNQQRDVIRRISSDRRIMNSLSKMRIPQDILSSILKI